MKKGILRSFRQVLKRDPIISEVQKECFEKSSFDDAEKELEKLKEEQDKVRAKVVSEFKSIFKDLPILL